MTGSYPERTPDTSSKAVIALTRLAFLLVALLPVALLAAVIVMIAGHVLVGLALLGGSVLAATTAVVLAGASGLRRLRKLLSGSNFNVMPVDGSQYSDATEPAESDYQNVVRLDPSEYTEVR